MLNPIILGMTMKLIANEQTRSINWRERRYHHHPHHDYPSLVDLVHCPTSELAIKVSCAFSNYTSCRHNFTLTIVGGLAAEKNSRGS